MGFLIYNSNKILFYILLLRFIIFIMSTKFIDINVVARPLKHKTFFCDIIFFKTYFLYYIYTFFFIGKSFTEEPKPSNKKLQKNATIYGSLEDGR